MEIIKINHPCVRNRCLDEDDVFMGCFRHVNEITAWQAADDRVKIQILQNALKRKNKKDIL